MSANAVTPRLPLYAFVAPALMAHDVFVTLLLAIAQATHEYLEWGDNGLPPDPPASDAYAQGAYESAAFVIACMLEQRYGLRVQTPRVITALDLSSSEQSDSARRKSIELLLRDIAGEHPA